VPGRVNVLSDTGTVYVAKALALYLTNEEIRRWIKEWYKRRPQYTRENLTDLMLGEPDN
jgi:hypothetical protein